MTTSNQQSADQQRLEQTGSVAQTPTPSKMTKAGGGHMSLTTENGRTRIADGVVAKIAGLAARDIPGVHSMGTGMTRRMGQLKSLVPGSSESTSAGQGVAVEVGEKEAAVDLDVVTYYGQSIVDVTAAVREHVIEEVQGMTGLKVVEVNISVDDIYVEGQDKGRDEQQRVQ
jgi:uncharacterized alkaline shock family protein YloU